MRTASGLGPGFTATEGHQGLGALPSAPSSPHLRRPTFGYCQSCACLPSLAIGVNGAPSARRALVQNGAGGPLDSEVLPAPGGGAAPISSPYVFGAHPSTRVANPSTPDALVSRDCTLTPAPLPSCGAVTRRAAAGRGRGASATSALTAVPAHNRARSAGRVAHLTSTDFRILTGAPRPVDLPANAVSAPSIAIAPRTTAPASSLTTQPQSGGEGHQSSAATVHTQPTGTHPGRPPTPACAGHRPSTLDSQEGRYR